MELSSVGCREEDFVGWREEEEDVDGRGGGGMEAYFEVGWREDDLDLVGRFDVWLRGSSGGTWVLGCREDNFEVWVGGLEDGSFLEDWCFDEFFLERSCLEEGSRRLDSLLEDSSLEDVFSLA